MRLEEEKMTNSEVLRFIIEELGKSELTWSSDKELFELICAPLLYGNDIIQKRKKIKNYKNSFNNWKNGKTSRINLQEVKKRLEQNFNFAPSLWDMNSATIKQALREGVALFVKHKIKKRDKITDIFDTIREEFNLKDSLSEQEQKLLENFDTMGENEMIAYFKNHYPLSKSHSQEFIQKLVSVLYKKGFYKTLLHNVIEALDMHLQENKEIKKIKADIYASPLVGEYLKAFDILSTIKTDDDIEVVSMRTEAISNIKRHYLSDKQMDIKDKQEIIQRLITYYDEIYSLNGTFHYYPAINLIYMYILDAIISEDEEKYNVLMHKINEIYHDSKKSIMIDKKSTDALTRYYANISKLEFSLLKGVGSPIAELAKYLELEEHHIPLVELTKTQRQMQFFIDTASTINGLDHPTIFRVQSAVEIIDDFMELRES